MNIPLCKDRKTSPCTILGVLPTTIMSKLQEMAIAEDDDTPNLFELADEANKFGEHPGG